MAYVIARFQAVPLSLDDGLLRSCIVCGCAFVLIMAERALPF